MARQGAARARRTWPKRLQRSARSAECHRNIEVIWLLRNLKPDFKTIADFRRDNRAAFRAVFRQFVLLCRRLDLYGRELLAVDGTRIKAVNNKDRNFTRSSLREFIRRADERFEDHLKRLDEAPRLRQQAQVHDLVGHRLLDDQAREVLGVETIDVVADRGYFKSRISRLARRPAAFPMFPSRSAARRRARACFARTSSDATPGSTPTSARPGSC
jgi:hypothetical protein